MSERIALYPGSFDPVTLGHLDILERATSIFDHIVMAVLVNPSKEPLFTAEERVEMLRTAIGERSNVKVSTFDGLTVDYASAVGAIAIVRGLRVVSDFENEFQMALMNRSLNAEVNTVFLMTSFRSVFISSTIIKEVCRLGGDVSAVVPPVSAEAMRKKFAGRRDG
jgi:pantetheine-phosphate adenylyltransferase